MRTLLILVILIAARPALADRTYTLGQWNGRPDLRGGERRKTSFESQGGEGTLSVVPFERIRVVTAAPPDGSPLMVTYSSDQKTAIVTTLVDPEVLRRSGALHTDGTGMAHSPGAIARLVPRKPGESPWRAALRQGHGRFQLARQRWSVGRMERRERGSARRSVEQAGSSRGRARR